MAEAPDRAFFELLIRARSGQASDREVADALGRLDSLCAIPAPGEAERVLRETQSMPRYVGITVADGRFALLAWSSEELAREQAIAAGMIEPGDSLMLVTSPPAARLFEVLENGWAAMVVDRGAPHEIACDTAKVAQLWGLLTWEGLARAERLWVMVCQGKPITQSRADGTGLQAFVYDSEGAARHGTQWMQEHAPGAEAHPLAPAELFQGLLQLGATEMLVDVATSWQRSHERDDLLRMAALLEGGGSGAR